MNKSYMNKSRKNKRQASKTRKQRGGIQYNLGTVNRTAYGINNGELNKKFTVGNLSDLGEKFKKPNFNACTLHNVSSLPNKDPNYIHVGYLYANCTNPYDFVSFEWFIEHYINEKVLPELKKKNKNDVKLDNAIQIHDFSIEKSGEEYLLKGNIYAQNMDSLNKGIQKSLKSKIPEKALIDDINEYISITKKH